MCEGAGGGVACVIGCGRAAYSHEMCGCQEVLLLRIGKHCSGSVGAYWMARACVCDGFVTSESAARLEGAALAVAARSARKHHVARNLSEGAL